MDQNIAATILTHKSNTLYEIKEDKLDEDEVIIVPVVMMVEGVHSGSGGAILHTAEQLGHTVAAWNGIPVVINHPQKDNVFVSANSPDLASHIVGRVYNAKYEDGKLKGEAWIIKSKITTESPIALSYIKKKKPLDVSVGTYTDNDPVTGEWNGEEYKAIAYNYRPDHLALLPDGEGACNWTDGCGIRVNSKNEDMGLTVNADLFKELNANGYIIQPFKSEVNITELIDAIKGFLGGFNTDLSWAYLVECYETYFIYSVSTGGQEIYFMTEYTYTLEDGVIKLKTENPKEVIRHFTYETLQRRTKINSNLNLNAKMDEQVTLKVNQLIANNGFTECDKTWLSLLSADALDKIAETKKNVTPAVPVLDTNAVMGHLKTNPLKLEDVLTLMSAEDRAMYDAGLAAYNTQRKTCVDNILANSKEFTAEELNGMALPFLEKLSNSIKTPASYAGQAAGTPVNVNTAKPTCNHLLLPTEYNK